MWARIKKYVCFGTEDQDSNYSDDGGYMPRRRDQPALRIVPEVPNSPILEFIYTQTINYYPIYENLLPVQHAQSRMIQDRLYPRAQRPSIGLPDDFSTSYFIQQRRLASSPPTPMIPYHCRIIPPSPTQSFSTSVDEDDAPTPLNDQSAGIEICYRWLARQGERPDSPESDGAGGPLSPNIPMQMADLPSPPINTPVRPKRLLVRQPAIRIKKRTLPPTPRPAPRNFDPEDMPAAAIVEDVYYFGEDPMFENDQTPDEEDDSSSD